MKSNSGLVEFRKLPRGSYRLDHDGMSADVWQIGGVGWAFNILDNFTGCYVDCGRGFNSLDDACEAAMHKLAI